MRSEVKAPWYIDLLNINLNCHSLDEARRRIKLFMKTFRKDGTRLTHDLDFEANLPVQEA